MVFIGCAPAFLNDKNFNLALACVQQEFVCQCSNRFKRHTFKFLSPEHASSSADESITRQNLIHDKERIQKLE